MFQMQKIDDRASNSLMFWGLVAGLFFYIFPVVFLPLGFPLVVVSYFILGVIWLIRPMKAPIGATPIHVVGVLFFVAAYAALVTTLRGTNDLNFAIQIAKVAILYLGSGVLIGLICIGFRNDEKFNIIIQAFVYCCLIQTVFILLGIVSIQFRVTMDSLIEATGNTNYLVSFRVRGFSASGGGSLGLSQAIGVLSALYLSSALKKSYFFWIAIVTWIPIFFVARTGFFFGAVFILIYFASLNRILHLLRSMFFRPVGIVGISVVLPLMLVVLPSLGGIFEAEALDRVGYALRWGFEIFLNAQAGTVETATTNALMDMLVIPNEPSYFLFGFGVFDTGAFGYERTDSGYLKTWYSSGVIGVIAVYGVLFYSIYSTAVNSNSSGVRNYILIILVVIVLAEVKEPFLYQNYLGRYVFIIIGAGAIINWDKLRISREKQLASDHKLEVFAVN